MGVYLNRVSPDELTEVDVRHLHSMLASDYDGYTVGDLARPFVLGTLQAWRIVGQAEGFLITQITEHPSTTELLVWGISGIGVAGQIQGIIAELAEFGREQECTYISAVSRDEKFTRVLQGRVGAKAVGTLMKLEIADVEPVEH